jgi:hypothetical protein
MRQTSKPWETVGMSRASWYRHGKPTEKPPKRETQAEAIKRLGGSVRTLQRVLRIYREPDLMKLVADGKLSIGKAEALVRGIVVGDGFIMFR